MTSTRLVAVLVVVAVAGSAIAPAASGSAASGVVDEPATIEATATETRTAETNASETESSSNTSVAAFMQTSAAETEQTVESGMFDAAFENATNESRADVVTDRTAELETRLERLEREHEALRVAENRSSPAYQARLTKLAVAITSLERSIERTKPRASDAGVDDDRLAELHSNASELAGSEVAAMASERGDHQGIDQSIGTKAPANQTSPGQSDADPPRDRSADDDTGAPSGNESGLADGDDSKPSGQSDDRGPSTQTDDRGHGSNTATGAS